MVTGASTANLAVILMDARKGVLIQSRRHAYIANLLRIPHLVVAVNKMDLVGYSREVFADIREEFGRFAARPQFRDMIYIPISALKGDMVVDRGENLPWYRGADANGACSRTSRSIMISISKIFASRCNGCAARGRTSITIFAATWDVSNREP